MHAYYVEYLEMLRGQHAELKRTLHGVPTEALDWLPTPEANSLAALAAHVAGAQSYLIGDLISGRPSQRNREGEFAVQRMDAVALSARLDAAIDDAAHVLEPLSLEDLTQGRYSARHQRTFTVAWLLHHTLEHTAQHVGHAQLTRQLWDQQESV